MISLIVPTLGKPHYLQRLFHSLKEQCGPPLFEVLLCLTGNTQEVQKQIPEELRSAIRILPAPESCISHARNLGIQQAQGELLFFLDEDTFLPHADYLQELWHFHRQHTNNAGGGFYINPPQAKLTSRFYNFHCNLWLRWHKGSEVLLLGGCAFYPRQWIQKHQLRFTAFYQKAGEEYEINRRWQELQLPIALEDRWNVAHDPHCGWKGLLQKSWRQGRALHQRKKTKLPLQNILRELNNKEFLAYLPLLTTFWGISRVASWSRRQSPLTWPKE